MIVAFYDRRTKEEITERIKRAITSVLGGYVLDDRNPFVRDGRGTLGAALKFIA